VNWLVLTRPFRYDWAQFNTACYISFFPFLPSAASGGPYLSASAPARRKKGKRNAARFQSEGRGATAPVTFASKADANALLANQQTNAGGGIWIDPSLGKEPLGDYAPESLDTGRRHRRDDPAKYGGLFGYTS